MEVSHVRQRLLTALQAARTRSQERRTRTAEAERAFETMLDQIAVPVARQLASAMKAEGIPFTVSTPGRVVRLTSDHRRDDIIELALDTSGAAPQLLLSSRRTRGSRVVDDERPLAAGRPIDAITEEEVLAALLDAVTPWLER